MKIRNHTFLLIASAILFSFSSQAQEERKVKESKVIIMKDGESEGERDVQVTVDGVDGIKKFRVVIKDENGTAHEYEWEGDEIPKDVRSELGDMDIDIVEMQDAEGQIEIKVETDDISSENENEIILKDEDGQERIIKWKSDGEMPEGLREQLEKSQGESGEMMILEKHSEKGSLNQENKIRIIKKDGSVIEWQGKGPIPEHIKKEMDNMDSEIQQVDVMRSSTSSNKAFLGIQLGVEAKVNVEDGKEMRTESLNVIGTVPGSGAEKAGLQKDDVLKRIGDTSIETYDDLNTALSSSEPGDKIEVQIERGGKEVVVEVELGTKPASLKEDKEKIIEKEVEIRTQLDGDDVQVDLSADLPILQLDQFEAYPNPSNGSLKVSFDAEAGPLKLMITDISGKSVYKEDLENFDGQYQNEIDLNRFPKGTLLLIIDQSGKRFTEKIVHQ